MLEDVPERAPVFAKPADEGARRVELDGAERPAATHGDTRDARRETHAEPVAERVGGIGGNGQDALAGSRQPDAVRGSAGRLADAAFAAKKVDFNFFLLLCRFLPRHPTPCPRASW